MAKQKLRIREATPSDIPALEALDARVYADFGTAETGSIARRVRTFPAGVLLGFRGVDLAAALYLRPIDFAPGPERKCTWKELENGGDFTPPENPRYMYGVGLVGTGGTADAMMIAGIQAGVRLGVERAFFGSRVPTLSEAFPQGAPTEKQVAEYVDSGKDWEIALYGKASILGIRMVRDASSAPCVLPAYFEDPPSHDFGVLWEWKNPFYNMPYRRAWHVLYTPLRAIASQIA